MVVVSVRVIFSVPVGTVITGTKDENKPGASNIIHIYI